ncbi:MAG TPA: hypothetical protein PKC40_03425, partial [Saprospiraceae bacterium]|nr:hypothetical protein [Saprospiraceae bacterium]
MQSVAQREKFYFCAAFKSRAQPYGDNLQLSNRKFLNMKLYNKVNNDELKQRMLESDEARVTLSFYQYANIAEPDRFRNELYVLLDKLGVFGRIYVAREGVNGQISVPESNFQAFKEALYSIPFLSGIRLNIAIEDDVKSITAEVEKLKAEGVNKIIAVTHIGYVRERDIIAKIPGVDVVVGGHSHSLLSNTDAKAEGP